LERIPIKTASDLLIIGLEKIRSLNASKDLKSILHVTLIVKLAVASHGTFLAQLEIQAAQAFEKPASTHVG